MIPRRSAPRRRRVPLLGVALAALLLLGGARRAAAQAANSYEQLQAFSAVLNYVRLNYADSVDYGRMVRAAIEGVLRSLDPHSYFLAAEDYRRRTALERGELATTGLVMELVEGRPTVLTVTDGSPAERAGVQPGDRLLAIDDSTALGLDVEHLTLRLAGPKGERVRLRFARGPVLEPDSFSVTLKRDFVTVPAVTAAVMVDSVTAYLRLAEFSAGSAAEVERALRDLRGDGMRRLVLDLRGDPGGFINAAVDIAGLFFPRGTVVFRTRGRRQVADEEFVTRTDGRFRELPLVVLIDGRSASASEALAGSLQDHDRALIVGRRSFGKALMQMPFFLQTGVVVFLTVGRVLTPRGRFIQRRYDGLSPEQYWALAGRTGAGVDTTRTFRTDAGRSVRGGGGIAPDLELPGPVGLPAWFSEAADSAWDAAVADSVAQTLPATAAARERWMTDSAAWEAQLLPPYLARVRARLGVRARADSAVSARLSRILARRTAAVRWGPAAERRFALQNDPDLRAALATFPDLPLLLAPPRP